MRLVYMLLEHIYYLPGEDHSPKRHGSNPASSEASRLEQDYKYITNSGKYGFI